MAENVSSADGGLKRVFNKPDFNPDKFISRVCQNDGTEILYTIQKLNRMTEETSTYMKLAIYNNFKLFIEASKAVTSLGSALHQLEHQLVEQKRLCVAFAEKSLFKEEDNTKAVSNTMAIKINSSHIASLLSSVDGVSNLVTDGGRQLLFEVDSVEVNATNYLRQGCIHLFVLSDYILVAIRQPDSYDSCKYKKQALYEIENVATVNLKGNSSKSFQNLVQLLVFPETRVFQFESLRDKRMFLSAIEEAKRLHLTGLTVEESIAYRSTDSLETDSLARSPMDTTDGFGQPPTIRQPIVCSAEIENACFEAIIATIPETATFIRDKRPAGVNDTGRHINPFHQESQLSLSTPQGADGWLWEAPEDIDVSVAVRDFAEATRLIAKARARIRESLDDRETHIGHSVPISSEATLTLPATLALKKLSDRIEQRAANLSLVLEEELAKAAERHGAVRSVRAAVLYLADLGKTVLGLHLFLAYRSSLLTRRLSRGVRQEGNQLVYLNRLSLTFHRQVVETVSEWNQMIQSLRLRRRFDDLEELTTSKLCSWVLEETVKFSNQLKIILIDSRSISFYAMGSATERIHAHATHVSSLIGIDVKSTLDSCLIKAWQIAAEEQARVHKDALELRASKETWQGLGLGGSDQFEANLKLMIDAGFVDIKQTLSGGRNLTSYTLHSSRSLSNFVQACAWFDCPELTDCFATCLAGMLESELSVYEQVLTSPKFANNKPLALENLEFFMHRVIAKAVTKLNVLNHPTLKPVMRGFKKLSKENH